MQWWSMLVVVWQCGLHAWRVDSQRGHRMFDVRGRFSGVLGDKTKTHIHTISPSLLSPTHCSTHLDDRPRQILHHQRDALMSFMEGVGVIEKRRKGKG